MRVCGLVLAAGGGARFGGPKALARTSNGEPWVARAVRMLRAGGCDDLLVTVGARRGEVTELIPAEAAAVVVPDWSAGLGTSLRAGVHAAADRECDVLVIVPVDTPDTPSSAVARVLAAVGPDTDTARGALVQAVYGRHPGHPAVVGRHHFSALADGLCGDRGARAYLVAHGAVEVECGDLWSGDDVDVRP
ncbi:NTP transferase domain-containing protein [Microbacterium awajiense]|uniref:NTP transferase domain-containing protein n=2 Tax=Microbacterium awajiense TaxID=415214 RepID=A0ABP7ANR9_9MICO